jgi:threonylcarbamoyladenosine tRNA methylthiotransferase MtaB
MRTFAIQTLGCKVNQYESEQIAALLRSRGLCQVDDAAHADLRIVNTCSVTIEAASKSRSAVRRAIRLPILTSHTPPRNGQIDGQPQTSALLADARRSKVIATGCWATSDRQTAMQIAGVDAVLGHDDDIAAELDRLLAQWIDGNSRSCADPFHAVGLNGVQQTLPDWSPEAHRDDLRMISGGLPAGEVSRASKPRAGDFVKGKAAGEMLDGGWRMANVKTPADHPPSNIRHSSTLPLLGDQRTGNQRAFVKVQDGCDAHCTYCIIPKLRPALWSKSPDDAVAEARRLVEAGHVELVLTGIFLGAYGQPTALRRRQPTDVASPLAGLVRALCTRVPGLRRLRLSSLEPGDLTAGLLHELRSHPQVMPHFHLPLQSGSEQILRRMNRQYTADDFRRMIDRVYATFDRPALTTDIIAGFPGETDDDFADTLAIVDHARFIHVHAFPFSPRPGTAAARWGADFVHGSITNQRIDALRARGEAHSLAFRQTFVHQTVNLLVERDTHANDSIRHGRCERYFDVHFEGPTCRPGDFVTVRILRATAQRTIGQLE